MDAAEVIREAEEGTGPLADLVEAAIRGPLLAAGFGVRDGQVTMARAVAEAIETGDNTATIAVEAPCGTGKSLAYLLPGLLGMIRERKRAGAHRRVVVSTAGISLQRQILQKDAPALARALGYEVRVTVLKGRNNYACPDKIETESALIGPDTATVRRVRDWLAAGGSGDREDLPWPVEPRAWSAASVSSDECLGASCPAIGICPAERVRKEVERAEIVVVNHWYLAVGYKRFTDGRTVALILDEAHDLEDCLRSAGGAGVRESTARYWGRTVSAIAHEEPEAGDEVARGIRDLILEASEFAGEDSRVCRLTEGWGKVGATEASDRLRSGATALRSATAYIQDRVDQDRARAKAQALDKLADRLDGAVHPDEAGACAWTETSEKGGTEVRVAPVAPKLPGSWGPVIACSATLGGGGDPGRSVEAVIGRETRGLAVPSPWPLARMAVAIVPQGPDPSEAGWPKWVEGCAVELVRALGGGVLVLCTSLSRSREIAERLRAEPYPVRCQGEAGRTELVEWFSAERDSVLVGSRSMFQGIDVPGDSLRGVLIDRVPFPSPGEPMEEAVAERLRRDGKDPFRARTLAAAATLLRQAGGRLIRSGSDRGAIVLTDPRVWRASWGRAILRALEPYPVTRDLGAAARVWAGESVATQVAAAPTARKVRR